MNKRVSFISIIIDSLPAAAGVGPVKHFVHCCDTVTTHGGYVSSRHDRKVHPRMHCQFLLNTG